MKRKEFNQHLRKSGYQREATKDEFGDYTYTYTHPKSGIVVKADEHTVDLEGSGWSCYDFLQAATLLVGAVEIGYGAEEFLSVWESLVGGY